MRQVKMGTVQSAAGGGVLGQYLGIGSIDGGRRRRLIVQQSGPSVGIGWVGRSRDSSRRTGTPRGRQSKIARAGWIQNISGLTWLRRSAITARVFAVTSDSHPPQGHRAKVFQRVWYSMRDRRETFRFLIGSAIRDVAFLRNRGLIRARFVDCWIIGHVRARCEAGTRQFPSRLWMRLSAIGMRNLIGGKLSPMNAFDTREGRVLDSSSKMVQR